MKKTILASFIISTLLAVPLAFGSSIKTWATGESIRASDLNTVLAHLHANLGHGHGAIVVNADVSASAAIAHTKLATPALVPKAWATTTAACAGAGAAGTACAVAASSGVASITANATAGEYRVNLTTNPSDASYGVLVSSHTATIRCEVDSRAATNVGTPLAGHFIVRCLNNANPEVATDSAITVMVLDNT